VVSANNFMLLLIIPPYNASSSSMSILMLALMDKVNSKLPNLHSVFGMANLFRDTLFNLQRLEVNLRKELFILDEKRG